MGPIGVVLDTNVIVSALGFGGPPLEALLRSLEDDVRLLASEDTLGELERVVPTIICRSPVPTECSYSRFSAVRPISSTGRHSLSR